MVVLAALTALCLAPRPGESAAVGQRCYQDGECKYSACRALVYETFMLQCLVDTILESEEPDLKTCKYLFVNPETNIISWERCPPGDCDKGQFKVQGPVVDTCVACDRGGYTSAPNNQTACTQCAGGRYQTSNGGTSADGCTECAAGSYKTAEGGQCQLCVEGTYASNTWDSACLACEAGTYASGSGATSCTECETGRYTTAQGATSCNECAPGNYKTAEAGQCQMCGEGTYAGGGEGSSVCLKCEAGTYASGSGATGCTKCGAGKYTTGQGATGCKECGQAPREDLLLTLACTMAQSCYVYLDCLYPECQTKAKRITDCKADDILGEEYPNLRTCKAQVVDPATQQTTWERCPPGDCDQGMFKVRGPVVDTCAPCDRGGYTSAPNQQTACTQCAEGKYQLWPFGVSANGCTECAAGSYKTTPPGETGQCQLCGKGTYARDIGSSACLACEAGKYSTGSGAANCIECSQAPRKDYFLTSACAADRDTTWQQCKVCNAAAGEARARLCTNVSDTQCAAWVEACPPSQRRYEESWINRYRCRPGQYLRGFNTSEDKDCRQCPRDMVGRNGLYCEWCSDQGLEEPYWLDQSSCVCRSPAVMNSTGGCACPDGRYHYHNRSETVRGRTDRCEPCPVNTYGVGGACLSCGAGRHTGGATGATGCQACEVGTYRLSGQAGCQNCSERGYYAPNTTSNACVACNRSCAGGGAWRDDGVCPGRGNEAFRVCAACDASLPPHAAWIGSCVYRCNAGYYYYKDGGCAACSTTACPAGFMWSDCREDADRGCETECVNTSKPMFNSKWAVATAARDCPWECEAGYHAVVTDYWMFQIHECAPLGGGGGRR